MHIVHFKLFFHNCTFLGETQVHIDRDKAKSYQWAGYHLSAFGMTDCVWIGQADCHDSSGCSPLSSLELYFFTNDVVPFVIDNCVFKNTKISVTIRSKDDVRDILLRDNTFSCDEETSNAAGVSLNLVHIGGHGNVTILVQNCSFLRQAGFVPNKAITGLNIKIEPSMHFEGYECGFVRIHHCTFANNNRGLLVSGRPVTEFTMTRSRFVRNQLLEGDGAAVFVDTTETQGATTSLIADCLFEGNTAGTTVQHKAGLKHTGGGYGGAIAFGTYLSQNLTLQNTFFRNNRASNFGGSIYNPGPTFVTLQNCTFESGTPTTEHGHVIYSSGKIVFLEVTILVSAAVNRQTMIEQEIGFVSVQNLSFTCPSGSNVHFYSEEQGYTTKNFQALKSLTIYCVYCQRDFYSLEHGHINVRSHKLEKRKQITCNPCPYGAKCDEKIFSKRNFWGFRSGNSLSMMRCRNNQCCSDKRYCQGHESCTGNRTGVLCHRCRHGYRQTIFFKTCHAERTPENIWFWPSISGFSLLYLYATIILFWEDVCQLLFKPKNVHSLKCDSHLVLAVFFSQELMLISQERQMAANDAKYVANKFLSLDFSLLCWDEVRLHETLSPIVTSLLQSMFGPLLVLFHSLLLLTVQSVSKIVRIESSSLRLVETKFVRAITLDMILMYQPFLLSMLHLLNCAHISGHDLLILDPNVFCFQTWQCLVMGFVALWLFLFPLHIALQGSESYSARKQIFVPLSLSCSLFKQAFSSSRAKFTRTFANKRHTNAPVNNQNRNAKDSSDRSWMAILLLRQILSCLTFVCLENNLAKTFTLSILTVASITHLLLREPATRSSRIWTEAVLNSVLLLVGIGNTVKTAFEVAEISARREALLKRFDLVEYSIFQWIPIILLIISLVYNFSTKIRRSKWFWK